MSEGRDQDGFAVPRRLGSDALFRHRGITGRETTRRTMTFTLPEHPFVSPVPVSAQPSPVAVVAPPSSGASRLELARATRATRSPLISPHEARPPSEESLPLSSVSSEPPKRASPVKPRAVKRTVRQAEVPDDVDPVTGPLAVRLHSLSGQNSQTSVTDFDVTLTMLEDIVREHLPQVENRSVRNSLRYFVSEVEASFLDNIGLLEEHKTLTESLVQVKRQRATARRDLLVVQKRRHSLRKEKRQLEAKVQATHAKNKEFESGSEYLEQLQALKHKIKAPNSQQSTATINIPSMALRFETMLASQKSLAECSEQLQSVLNRIPKRS